MGSHQNPVVLPPLETNSNASSRKSTVIFLHGLGDDGRGVGLALAQQFQSLQKLRDTKWILPTARMDRDVGERCWYKPHSLLSALKSRVPAEEESMGEDVDEGEDEDGLREAIEYIDHLVTVEVNTGTDPSRIVVGGFSQGCAVSILWGLKGQWRDKVAGVFGLSGYFPKSSMMLSRETDGEVEAVKTTCKWFFGHGMADLTISISLFANSQRRLQQYIRRENIEGHVYKDLGHDIGGAEIRDLWLWLKMVFRE